MDNAALLEKAGVEIVIAEIGNAHNARNARQEAGIAVAYGLSPSTALEALTSNPAEIFGVDARYGTVAKGKVANLVVWPEDPFELSSFPTQVWVRGEIVPDDSRHKQLRDRYLDLSKFKP